MATKPIEPISKFWMVWGVQRGMPRYRHMSKASARDEAERLARQAPGEVFVVLSAVEARLCSVSEPQTVPLIPPAPGAESPDEIPF